MLGPRNQNKSAPRSKKKCPLPAPQHAFFCYGTQEINGFRAPELQNPRIPCSRAPNPSIWLSAIPEPLPSYKSIPWIALRAWLLHRKVPAAKRKLPARLLPPIKKKLKTTNSLFPGNSRDGVFRRTPGGVGYASRLPRDCLATASRLPRDSPTDTGPSREPSTGLLQGAGTAV